MSRTQSTSCANPLYLSSQSLTVMTSSSVRNTYLIHHSIPSRQHKEYNSTASLAERNREQHRLVLSPSLSLSLARSLSLSLNRIVQCRLVRCVYLNKRLLPRHLPRAGNASRQQWRRYKRCWSDSACNAVCVITSHRNCIAHSCQHKSNRRVRATSRAKAGGHWRDAVPQLLTVEEHHPAEFLCHTRTFKKV